MVKIIKVDSCDNCPHNGGCKAWKVLSSKQRVMLSMGVGVGPFILNGCILEDEKPVVDEQKRRWAEDIVLLHHNHSIALSSLAEAKLYLEGLEG